MKQKSRLCEAVTYKHVGECPVDIDKAMTLWNSKCFISKFGVFSTEFVLGEYDQDERTGRNMRLCRFTISKSDAMELIKRLNLNYYPECAAGGFYAHTNPGTVYMYIQLCIKWVVPVKV